MTTLADLTDAERRILRAARDCDKAVFNGKQRLPINKLHALGLIERPNVLRIPGQSRRHGRDAIGVVITRAGDRLFWRSAAAVR